MIISTYSSETLEILYYLIYKITNIQKFNSFKSLLRDKSELHSKEIDAELIRKGLTIEAPIPQKFKVTKQQQQQQAQPQQNKTTTPSLRLTTNTVFGKPSITKKRKHRLINKDQVSQGTINDDFDDESYI